MQSALSPSAPPDTSELAPGEALATALDSRVIDGPGPEPWMIHVLGVHSDDRDVWLQIAPAGDVTASLVLRLSRQATVAHAVASLALGRPAMDRYPRIIDVMRVHRTH
jgi:hypothetical protein